MRIAIVAPSNRIDQSLVEWVKAIAAAQFGNRPFAQRPELVFHPQCFLSSGHFAGTDRERAAAFLEVANDPAVDAVWFARGGYGAGRLLPHIEGALGPPALEKTYLGYSDAGNILALLMKAGVPDLAHGPMPTDIRRDGGEAALRRALAWLVDLDPETVEPSARNGAPAVAFNLTVLSHLIGTPWQPDLAGRVLMVEDIDEYMYRLDRALWQVLSAPGMERIAGLRLGRCGEIPENDPDFVLTEEEMARERCAAAGVPYLGRADIGHDAGNKLVPMGG
ncbi:MAG: LD-carboxypeptidase [Rhodospirillaceae bacterium]|nr:LD-carboxypeptidase [Rhodospirillaceae bacterium]